MSWEIHLEQRYNSARGAKCKSGRVGDGGVTRQGCDNAIKRQAAKIIILQPFERGSVILNVTNVESLSSLTTTKEILHPWRSLPEYLNNMIKQVYLKE